MLSLEAAIDGMYWYAGKIMMGEIQYLGRYLTECLSSYHSCYAKHIGKKHLPCEICGAENTCWHHSNYAAPDKTNDLCEHHHKFWHHGYYCLVSDKPLYVGPDGVEYRGAVIVTIAALV